jgi:signal transduction histidine kinase
LSLEDDRRALEAMGRTELVDEVLAARLRAVNAEGIQTAFLSAMTHELRTPLNAILGFTEVLLEGLSGPVNEVQARQLGSVDKSARRLIELIDDVLDLAKAQAGQLELSREEFDLGRSVRKVAVEVGAEAERRGLPLTVQVGPGAERAVGDMRRTEQVLRHLMTNAVKFTEEGGVKVEVQRDELEIVTLVADTGIGIDQGQLGRLFKPFSQLDAGRARRYGGAGLGLSLSKLFIDAMGGRIWADSRPGGGSTFGFSLPAPPEPGAGI